jgi:hypothetical protein
MTIPSRACAPQISAIQVITMEAATQITAAIPLVRATETILAPDQALVPAPAPMADLGLTAMTIITAANRRISSS